MPPVNSPPRYHHKWLAILTACALGIAAVLAISGTVLPRGEKLWHIIAGPEKDGDWRAVLLDGNDVRNSGYAIELMWGDVRTYNDGCNSCGVEKVVDAEAEHFIRSCTMQACPSKPYDHLFRQVVLSRPSSTLDDNRLILTVPGHRAELVRAKSGS